MTNERIRPAGVPETAYWDQDDHEWVVAQHNGDGQLHGIVTYYRPDGTRAQERPRAVSFRESKKQYAYRKEHPRVGRAPDT